MSDDVGQIIRFARERRGWSQEFLAAKVGATQSTIDRIESGLTRKSRVLPELATVLEIELPGFERRQSYTAPVGSFVRVNYVLPRELIERIEEYKSAIGVSSDDEVVRRIIDDFLKKRDDIVAVVSRIVSKYKTIRSLREAASAVLANHPLVGTMTFDSDGVKFVFKDAEYGKLYVVVPFYGSVMVSKEDEKPFMFHVSDAPKWVGPQNVTEKAADADYIAF